MQAATVVYVLFFSGVVLVTVDGVVKKWRYDTDINDPHNWAPESACEGVHFAPENSAPVFIFNITAHYVLLPKDGELRFVDGGYIDFRKRNKCKFNMALFKSISTKNVPF